MHLVVARYREPVGWCRAFPHTVYNKGPFLLGSTPLPNIGREAHTYLHHIVTHYDALDDVTVFLQGNPFDHSPHLLQQLATLGRPDFRCLSELLLRFDHHSDWRDPDLPLKEFDEFLYGPGAPPRLMVFGAGAQFAVSRERIRQKPKQFYETLLALVSRSPVPGSQLDTTTMPWVLERFWGEIFTR